MLLWKTKKFYLQNLNVKDLSDKKKKKKIGKQLSHTLPIEYWIQIKCY